MTTLEDLKTKAEKNELSGLFDLDIDIYHHRECPGISKSHLQELLRSPAHYQEWLKNPDKPTADMEFGSACHVAVLEPELFKEKIITWPEEILLKAGKPGVVQMREDFKKANSGKIVISKEQIEIIGKIIESVYSHPLAHNLLEGMKEKTLFWKNEESDLLCKARPDCINKKLGMIVDLKITSDASNEAFKRTTAKFGYHLQAAFYMQGINLLKEFDGINQFVFVCVENKAPYSVAIYELHREAMGLGSIRCQEMLEIFKKCSKTKSWPGYPNEIQELTLPAWAFF